MRVAVVMHPLRPCSRAVACSRRFFLARVESDCYHFRMAHGRWIRGNYEWGCDGCGVAMVSAGAPQAEDALCASCRGNGALNEISALLRDAVSLAAHRLAMVRRLEREVEGLEEDLFEARQELEQLRRQAASVEEVAS